MDYHLAIKKNEVVPFAATWMDLEIFIVSEVRQKWKDKYYIGITYMCDLKNNANLCTKQSHKHR